MIFRCPTGPLAARCMLVRFCPFFSIAQPTPVRFVGGKSADQVPSLLYLNEFPTPRPDLGTMAANHHQIKGCARQALLGLVTRTPTWPKRPTPRLHVPRTTKGPPLRSCISPTAASVDRASNFARAADWLGHRRSLLLIDSFVPPSCPVSKTGATV
jgi:hypothetical protein